MKVIPLMVVVTLTLSACGTPYQSEGFTGGHSEVQLNANTWKISARGNGFTGRKEITDMALLRAAELTKAKGYTHFAIVDSAGDSDTRVALNRTATYDTYGNLTYGPTVNTTTKYSRDLIIRMFKKNIDGSYDATTICRSLGKSFQVTC